jgi:hypothetical protein
VTRKDRNETSYRRALQVALIVSLVAHGVVIALGRLRVTTWSADGKSPALVLIDLDDSPIEEPLEVIELREDTGGTEAAETPSSAAVSEAVDGEASEQTAAAVDPATSESTAPRVVFTNPERDRAATVFLTTVSTDNTGPTLATDATIEDLLIKKAPESREGAGVDDEEQWASARPARRGGGGIGIGIGGGGYGDGDSCKPGGRIITNRVPLGTGRFRPRF